jgi:phage host-nuclease inhibitor protein Gam
MTEKRIRAFAQEAPQDLDQMAESIRKIGEKHGKIDQIEDELEQEVQKLTKEARGKVAIIEDEILDLFAGMTAFAESRRTKLTQKSKTTRLPTGTFGWRTIQLSIDISREQAVAAVLEEMGFESAIRKKPEVKKTDLKKLLAEHREEIELIDGVTINDPRESFWVKPLETNLRVELGSDGRLVMEEPKAKKKSG